MNRFLLVSTLFLIGACATPSTEPTPPDASQVVEAAPAIASPAVAPDPATESVPAEKSASVLEVYQVPDSADDEIAEIAAPTSLVAGVDNSRSNNIQDIEAPEVEQTALPERSMHRPRRTDESEIVCDRIIPTGSRIPVDICRTKTEIERKQEQDQRIMDDIKRNTAIGASRL